MDHPNSSGFARKKRPTGDQAFMAIPTLSASVVDNVTQRDVRLITYTTALPSITTIPEIERCQSSYSRSLRQQNRSRTHELPLTCMMPRCLVALRYARVFSTATHGMCEWRATGWEALAMSGLVLPASYITPHTACLKEQSVPTSPSVVGPSSATGGVGILKNALRQNTQPWRQPLLAVSRSFGWRTRH